MSESTHERRQVNCDPDSVILNQTDDVRINKMNLLTPPEKLLGDLPLSHSVAETVLRTRQDVHRILVGTDQRMLVIIGPCSVHDYRAAIEYATWLSPVRERYAKTALILMRVYFEKPRTLVGWKGIINDPYLDGSFQINDGLRLARRLLLEINEMGLPTASEFVDLITPQYTADLMSWAAIGARTVESQVHRELASGLSCPVGFKNTTQGDIMTAINAVLTARNPHHFLSVTKSGVAAIVSTTGNPDCHIVLRGGSKPNYDQESVGVAVSELISKGLPGKVMIDCSHGNSDGDFRRQVQVAECVRSQMDRGSRHIFGLMAESNLVEGRQKYICGQPLVYGQSITDPCVGLKDTIRILATVG
jgi:3-deoxy-7-phosphoheptulonate synthase